MAKQVKTQVGNLKYVFIKGEGRNQALKGEEPRMQYVASIVTKKDSPLHKDILEQINAEWNDYKKAKGIKGLPKTNGIKDVMVNDPKGTIDPQTEEVMKVPSGEVLITFKTNTKWANGDTQVVKVKDRKGNDITAAYSKVDYAIGEGSQGRIFGTASANDIGGTNKVTLYLTGIQLAKLVKYIGNDFEADEIDGEDIDIDEDFTSEVNVNETPQL